MVLNLLIDNGKIKDIMINKTTEEIYKTVSLFINKLGGNK